MDLDKMSINELEETIAAAKRMLKEKKIEEMAELRDFTYDFVHFDKIHCIKLMRYKGVLKGTRNVDLPGLKETKDKVEELGNRLMALLPTHLLRRLDTLAGKQRDLREEAASLSNDIVKYIDDLG